MTELTDVGERPGTPMPCHCCRAAAEVTCPLCSTLHCQRCQLDVAKPGGQYISKGVCPECRSLISKAIENRRESLPRLLRGPSAFKNQNLSEKYASWQEYLEFQLMEFSEALYLTKRARKRMPETEILLDTLERIERELAAIPDHAGAPDIALRARTWKLISDELGRIPFILRQGAAVSSGCSNITTERLFRDVREAIESLFMIMVIEGSRGLLTPAVRRSIEEYWSRSAALCVELFERTQKGTQAPHHLRAALNHLSEVRNTFLRLPEAMKDEPGKGTRPVIHETLRFLSHLSISNFRRAGLLFGQIDKFLNDTISVSGARLGERNTSEESPLGQEAFQIYLKAGVESFESELLSTEPGTQSVSASLKQARSWAWLAICSASLSGYPSKDSGSIGQLWMAYLADLDERLASSGDGQAVVDEKALLELEALSRKAGKAGSMIAELTRHVRSIWELEQDTARRGPGFELKDVSAIATGYPWISRYIDHVQTRLQGRLGRPVVVEKAPLAVREEPAAVAAPRFRVHGTLDERTEGLWVVWGWSGDARPPAFGAQDVLVDAGDTAAQMAALGEPGGLDRLGDLLANKKRHPSVLGLVAVLDFGGQEPMVICCGGEDAEKPVPQVSGIITLADPEMLLVPDGLREAAENWSYADEVLGDNLPRPSLFVVNRAVLSREGVFQTIGKMKNSM